MFSLLTLSSALIIKCLLHNSKYGFLFLNLLWKPRTIQVMIILHFSIQITRENINSNEMKGKEQGKEKGKKPGKKQGKDQY